MRGASWRPGEPMLLRPSLERSRLVQGATAGILGGVVFGLMMTAMGMMPMVGMLVGSTSLTVGWGVHLALSLAFGAAFGATVAPGRVRRVLPRALLWSFALWLVAATVVMRTLLGMPIAPDAVAAQSLVGHLAYGLVLGLAYVHLPAARTTARPPVGAGMEDKRA